MLPKRLPNVVMRALSLSLAALAAALLAATLAPEAAARYEVLLWLLAITPAFLLAYYRGWNGVATALAGCMVALVVIQFAASMMGREIQDWGLALRIMLVFLGTSAGVGWLSELLYRARRRLDELELTDELTGLPNERHAMVMLEREFAGATRGRPLHVVLFDVDDYKRFRDKYGQKAYEDALKDLGRILKESTRRMNFTARISDERFLSLVCSGGPDGALIFARRIQSALALTPAAPLGFTVSAGIASYHPGMESPRDLLQAADLALYQAQQQGGRGNAKVYEPLHRLGEIKESLRQVRELLGKTRQLGFDRG
ncbi:MAG TPA: GGDEF domain-containing protein [Longimicrobiales bacterium]